MPQHALGTSTLQTDRQPDGWMTYNSNTALALHASCGKKEGKFFPYVIFFSTRRHSDEINRKALEYCSSSSAMSSKLRSQLLRYFRGVKVDVCFSKDCFVEINIPISFTAAPVLSAMQRL